MKKNKLYYTEYKINMSPSNAGEWLKLIVTHIIISPIRLINEISGKILFLNQETILNIIMRAILVNAGFIVWSTFIGLFTDIEYNFISFPVLITSILILALLYLKVSKINSLAYDIIKEDEDKLDEIAAEKEGDEYAGNNEEIEKDTADESGGEILRNLLKYLN